MNALRQRMGIQRGTAATRWPMINWIPITSPDEVLEVLMRTARDLICQGASIPTPPTASSGPRTAELALGLPRSQAHPPPRPLPWNFVLAVGEDPRCRPPSRGPPLGAPPPTALLRVAWQRDESPCTSPLCCGWNDNEMSPLAQWSSVGSGLARS